MARIPLGAFDLHEPLAEGGMGVVWRARHRGTDDAVAVKVLTRAGVEHPKVVEALYAEVVAMASLSHRHVVAIHDYGLVSARAASLSSGVLAEGSPWFAMELVEGGTLADRRWTPDYDALRRAMLALLQALAHAHAHGLIHRDLKPRNVLLGGTPSDAEVKLTDFGLAFARARWIDLEGGAPGVAGTPTYLAPEQVRGDPTGLGPWTDLYAAGCVAWSLACGRRPYRPADIKQQVRAHRDEPVPELRPWMPVPDGFDAWVYRLMAKRPSDRFQTAADAARALMAIDGADPGPPPWMPDAHPAPRPLPGTGLTLLGVRALPIVGREREQRLLGEELDRIADDRIADDGARVIVIRGPAGVGRSALGEWACRRAAETGRAFPVRISHTGSQVDGLVGGLARALGLRHDATQQAWIDRLRERWHDDPGFEADLAPLGAMLRGEPLDPSARLPLAARTLDRLRGDRPVLLWVDDAMLGSEALRFVHGVVQRRAFPTLALVAVRDERAPERPDEQRLLRDLPVDRTLPLQRLTDPELEELMAHAIDLDPAARARLLARAGGNPWFLLELLRDQVSSGRVHLGAASTLRLSGDAELPATLTELWRSRVHRLLDGHPEWQVPLEVAATLGDRVDVGEWRAACEVLDVVADRGLVLALLREHLVVREPGARLDDAFRLAHPMLREAVLQLAATEERAEALHGACADALAALPGVWQERVGAHRRAAGQLAEAVDDLVEGAWQRTFRGDLLGATHLAEELEALLAPDDPRRGAVLRTRVRAARLRGEHEETLLRLRRLLHWARGRDDPRQLAIALQQRAVVRVQAGAPDAAVGDAEEAVEVARTIDDDDFRAQAFAWLGLVRARAHDPAGAADAFDAADGLASNYLATYGRGVVLLDLGHPADAVPLLREASRVARQRADPMNAAQFDAVLAQALRLSGDPEQATTIARAALQQLDGWQVQWASEARVSLALCELRRGRAHHAEALLRTVVDQDTQEEAVQTARAVLLALAVRRGRRPDIDLDALGHESLSRAYEREVAALLRDAADAAERGGHPGHAELARRAAARLMPR